MPQPRKAASPTKGEAAVAELAAATPKPKSLTWRGIDLTLPPTMAAMGVSATFRRLQKASEAEDGQATMGYLIDLVDVILGGDERQADQVWAAIDASDGDAFDMVFELLNSTADCYGATAGESAASQ